MRQVLSNWWPLAASWLLMSIELPAVSAVVARLADPTIHLAAYGGIVFPLALLIEAPIIMLLAASTALSRDADAYHRLRRYMMASGAFLTGLHILIAFTPLYYVVVEGLIGAPEEIVEPARIGLMIMTPWTWSIASRRFHQGVLIRFGRSRLVSLGTLVRLLVDVGLLLAGYLLYDVAGIVVATVAVAAGVMAEALYIGIKVRPVVRKHLSEPDPKAAPLHLRGFLNFYIPLALTSLMTLVIQPIGSAALSRMPDALESLAVWPVVFGFIFLLRSLGLAYQEVVVAMLEIPGNEDALRRFSLILTAVTTCLLILVAATPLSRLWFETVSGLPPELSELARTGLWFGLLLPALSVLKNWFQGILVHARRTRSITEAVTLFVLTCGILLWIGVRWVSMPGLYWGLGAFSLAAVIQAFWVWRRSRNL